MTALVTPPALATVPQAPAEATVPEHRRSGHMIIALHGHLDVTAAPALRERLLGALRSGAQLMVVDLDDVGFCDAAGLAVLIGTQRRATGLGVTLCLAAPGPQVTELLRLTGLDRCLTIHPTVSGALDRPSRAVLAAVP